MFSIRTYLFLAVSMALLLYSPASFADKDKPEYGIFHIPPTLLLNSHTVVREEQLTFELQDLQHTVRKEKIVKTILNQEGNDDASLFVFYDKETKVRSLTGSVYDANGKFIRKLKNSDIKDYSAISSFSIYEDSRVKEASLLNNSYPFTVEFEYEIECAGSYHFPSWSVVDAPGESVEHTMFKIVVPSSYELRFLEQNLPDTLKKTSTGNFDEYMWEVNNYAAVKAEPFMVDYKEIVPRIDVAPSAFSLNLLEGNSSTWTDLGSFFWSLNKDRDKLPDDFINELKSLTANANSDKEKVKLIYNYLQKTTRYVSIQLGIGGFQPFEASYVHEKGYGDCKALSNYMYAMLKALDIRSIYTLVNAGSNKPDIKYNFPSDQFNHVILCVPNNGDTVWLECTSQTIPFGYLSRFTMDRHVLLITENGGVIVKTPSMNEGQNLQLRKATVTLQENGSAIAQIKTRYEGYQFENIADALEKSEEKQKKFLYKSISIPSFEISSFNFTHEKDINPKACEELNITMKRYASISGKRLFFKPNLMNQATKIDLPEEKRLFDMELRFPYTDIDSVEYLIPEGYHLEYVPEKTEVASAFGSYNSSIVEKDGKVIFVRKRIGYKGKYAAEKYKDFVKFVNDIAEADQKKLVLVKET